MKKINFLAASAVMAFAASINAFSQNNLGESCGCPPVSGRGTPILLSTMVNPADSALSANQTLTCDKIYILDHKIYVPSGRTLTIQPGSLIKGRASTDTKKASALIVAVGGKIIADGSSSCPIVFTAEADNMDGNYPICSRGKWGGLVLLGRATNNLVTSNAFSASTTVDGIGFVEGYEKANNLNKYGKTVGGVFDDADNSGTLRYVSVRHAGAIIVTANELNGISLGSVGSGTTIENLELVGSDDDGIEFFGGTVNVKKIAMWWGNDDMFDWDLGWKGKGQFLFGIVDPDRTAIPGADNGFESDGDDNSKYTGQAGFVLSHPVIYNATFIGDGNNSSADFSGPAAIKAKESTEGEIYNSVFANYRYGFDVNKKRTNGATPPVGIDSYDKWVAATPTLIVKNNTFIRMTGGLGAFSIVGSTRTAAAGTDLTKFTNDKNTYVQSVPGFDYTFNMTCAAVIDKFDAIPNPALSADLSTPTDPWFQAVSYRGAFGSGTNWLDTWSYGALTSATADLIPCPTDVNNDGQTNGSDYLLLLGNIFTTCQ